MRCAVDIDGTIDANPREMQSLMSALQAAGHTVIVVTGTSDKVATQQEWQEKANFLTSLGCGECWDSLVVIAHVDGDIAQKKADWLAANNVHLLIDNALANAKAACSVVPLVLVPWASRVKEPK